MSGPRVQPVFVAEDAATVGEHGEGVGLAAHPVQGHRQPLPHPFSQWMLGTQAFEFRHHRLVTTQCEQGGDAVLDTVDPQLLQPGRLCDRERRIGDVRQRRPSPQRQRTFRQGQRELGIALGPRPFANRGRDVQSVSRPMCSGPPPAGIRARPSRSRRHPKPTQG